MQTNSIPNIQIENIGAGRSRHKVIKGFVELPCWTNYFLTEETNYLFKTKVIKNGRIELWVNGGITADGRINVDEEQVNSYYYLVEHQDDIKNSIVQSLKQVFPDLLENEYASWDHDEGGFPKLSELTPDFDFGNYIGPSSISILEDKKEGVAYIEWHFQCLWDPEHGFQIITHKDRVIDIAQEADVFKIYNDNGTYAEVEKGLMDKNWKLSASPKKKKWWQFW